APTRSPLAAGLAALEPSDAEAAVNEIFAIAGISAVGGRDASEIADRLIAQQQAGDSLPADTAAALTRFLDISGDAREAEKTLADFAKDVGVDINAALSRYVDRLDALKRLSPSLQADLVFGAEFGRRFDYYDGLVIELSHPAFPDDRAIAAGGRYDGLISELSRGDASATALGGVLRPDRLAIAAEADQ
ncbi:MAG: ATP phosphoribosyltransferase regulatory subunit, partial [Pseudomonadota bacterium]